MVLRLTERQNESYIFQRFCIIGEYMESQYLQELRINLMRLMRRKRRF